MMMREGFHVDNMATNHGFIEDPLRQKLLEMELG